MQLDAVASRNAKETGMQRALDFSSPWSDDVLLELRAWLQAKAAQGITVVTVEAFRATAKAQPASANAWGSLPRLAAKAGLLERVRDAEGNPVYRKATAVKTHAHPVGLYRILQGATS